MGKPQITYYLKCLFCNEKYKSHDPEKLCPQCWSKGRIYGLRDSTTGIEEDDTGELVGLSVG